MSKIGIHAQTKADIPQPGWPATPLHPEGNVECLVENWYAYCQPAVIAILMDEWSPAAAQRLRTVCPKTFILGRMFDHAKNMDRVIAKARELEGQRLENGQWVGGVKVFSAICGGNEGDWSPEPVMDNPADLDKINLIETENAVKAHAAGYKYGMGSWSYGATEQLNAAPHRWQYMKKALEKADVLVIHSYGSNEQYGGKRDRSFDYRKLYADISAVGFPRPIFIKEFGPSFQMLEAVVRGELWDRDEYLRLLEGWDKEWAKDDYLIGVCLWNWNGGKYEGGKHDLNRNPWFTGGLAGYIVNGIPARKYWDWTWKPPIVSPPPAPTPVPAPTPQPSGWPKLRHFVPQEFKRPELLYHRTLILADLTREAYGPLRITGDHRTPEENAAVGGLPQSLHLHGKAIDLIPAGGEWDQEEMYKLAKAALAAAELMGLDKNLEIELDDRPGRRHLHLGVATDGREIRLIVKG